MRQVLVAENDSNSALLVEAVLEMHDDWELVLARNGREALDIVASERPDIALLDIGMPVLNGIDTCKAMKADAATASIPVVMVSGSISDEIKQSAYDAGAAAFLAKPYRPQALLSILDQLTTQAA